MPSKPFTASQESSTADDEWRADGVIPPPPLPHDDHVPDIEILNPTHYCPTRRATLVPATFNLVATIVGGGILSIPLAFEKCGLVLATILMILSLVTTDFSLYILCSVSRRTGAGSYLEACRVAYGQGLELSVTILLFVFLLFVICAYFVLIRDIWTPIVLLIVQPILHTERSSDKEEVFGDAVLLLIIILISPFLLKKDLHALRYNCYLGFGSISVLCLAMAYRAYQKVGSGEVNVRLWPESLTDVLFAYPIPVLAFMCHFNVIGVHASLVNPTRKRVRMVIDGSMALSGVLTYSFGLFGYMWGGSDTAGNILLSYDFSDRVILIGRVGCGITIMLASAMITLPCRESLLALGPFFEELKDAKTTELGKNLASSSSNPGYGAVGNAGDEEGALGDTYTGTNRSAESEDYAILQKEAKCTAKDGRGETDSSTGQFLHVLSTFLIVAVCYIGAVSAPGVATVWSICGCLMAFIIAFILPSLCYIKVRAGRKGHGDARVFSAWALFAISVAGAILCTTQTIWRLFFMN